MHDFRATVPKIGDSDIFNPPNYTKYAVLDSFGVGYGDFLGLACKFQKIVVTVGDMAVGGSANVATRALDIYPK